MHLYEMNVKIESKPDLYPELVKEVEYFIARFHERCRVITRLSQQYRKDSDDLDDEIPF